MYIRCCINHFYYNSGKNRKNYTKIDCKTQKTYNKPETDFANIVFTVIIDAKDSKERLL